MKRHGSLNRIYRIIWSHVLNAWVAVAENVRGRGKSSARKLISAALSLTAALAQASPIGGQVVAGAGAIAQSGNVTTITQSSQNLSLNWKSFNVGSGETVNFLQPSASAIAVNRIFDTNGTQILGHLNANGQVYLINPNGILFGKSAQVNVGGLVASTLDNLSSSGSNTSFSGSGTGRVENDGSISGRYVALLGNTVINSGSVSSMLGAAVLGAGSRISLTFSGTDLVSMQVDRGVLNALVQNGGAILADGGRVILSAGAKNDLLASVVNNTGIVEARTVLNRNGVITLLAGMKAGTVKVGGTLDASAPDGGAGGSIETSAAHVQVSREAKVTARSANGLTGSWLIDPQDFTIAATGGDMTGTALSNSLATTSVTILSSSGASSGSGNINVNDTVSWSANTLTLTAANNVNINAVMTATGSASLSLNPSTANGADAAVAGGTINVALGGGGFTGRVDFNTTGTLSIGGVAYTVINSLGAAGDATTAPATPTLQGMAATANLAGHFVLGSNIDATATSTWNAGAGFTPIGSSAVNFTGVFDGLGHTISNLTINRPATNNVGLFGSTYGSGIRNVGAVGGSVSGGWYVGGLVGENNNGKISNSYATGTVSGSINGQDVGGLVGWNGNNSLTNVYATGNVNGSSNVGGLVGWNNYGTVSNSYATGNVTGSSTQVGGLLGGNYGHVNNSYATGSVSGSDYVGGLVGNNINLTTISNSYAAGKVVSAGTRVGGLLGSNSGSVSNSFWDTTASGMLVGIGGVGAAQNGATGMSTSQMQTQANYTSATAANGNVNPAWDVANTWVMYDAHTDPMLRSFMSNLTVTANSATQTYNGLVYGGSAGISYSGYAGTLNSSVLFNTSSFTFAGGDNSGKNVGTYSLNSAMYSSQQGYIINYVAGNLTINKANLTVTANNQSMTYGGTMPALTASYSGFVNGESASSLTTQATVSSGTAANANAGTYAGTLTASGAVDPNYAISYVAGNLTIEKAALTDTANTSNLYSVIENLLKPVGPGHIPSDHVNASVIDGGIRLPSQGIVLAVQVADPPPAGVPAGIAVNPQLGTGMGNEAGESGIVSPSHVTPASYAPAKAGPSRKKPGGNCSAANVSNSATCKKTTGHKKPVPNHAANVEVPGESRAVAGDALAESFHELPWLDNSGIDNAGRSRSDNQYARELRGSSVMSNPIFFLFP